MKKLIYLLFALVLFAGCQSHVDLEAHGYSYDVTSDALSFKISYEELNGMPNPHNPERVFKDVYIPANNPIRFAEFDDIIDLLETGGTGVVYLSFPICPWCRTFAPVLIETANQFGIHEILYRNILDDRNILELRDGEVYETRAGHPGYYRLLELLGDLAPVYTGLEDDSIRRVFVPALLFIKDGEVVRYQGALGSFQERVAEDELGGWQSKNEDEINELSEIFLHYFHKLFGNIDDCTEPC